MSKMTILGLYDLDADAWICHRGVEVEKEELCDKNTLFKGGVCFKGIPRKALVIGEAIQIEGTDKILLFYYAVY